MEESGDTLVKKGEILLAAINTASRTPLILERLKYMLFKNKKQPHEIFNKHKEATTPGDKTNYLVDVKSFSAPHRGKK